MPKVIGKQLLTTTQIAKKLNESLPRIQYVLAKYQISASEMAGNTRLFDAEQYRLIRSVLRRTRKYKDCVLSEARAAVAASKAPV